MPTNERVLTSIPAISGNTFLSTTVRGYRRPATSETCKDLSGRNLRAKSFKLDEHGNPVKGIKTSGYPRQRCYLRRSYHFRRRNGDRPDSIIGGNAFIESVPLFHRVQRTASAGDQKELEKNHKRIKRVSSFLLTNHLRKV